MLTKANKNDLSKQLRNDNIIIIDASYPLQQFLNYYSTTVYDLTQVILANISNVINSDTHTTKIIGIPTDHNSDEWHNWHGRMLHFKNSVGDNPQFYPTPFYMSDKKITTLCDYMRPQQTKTLNQLIQHICHYLANLTNDDILTIDDNDAYDMIIKSMSACIEDPETKWINVPHTTLHDLNPLFQQYDAENNMVTPRSQSQIEKIKIRLEERKQKQNL